MTRYIIRRIFQLVPVIIGISIVTFLMMTLVPGDPVVLMLGQHISPQTVENVRHGLGLDQPMLTRYLQYMWNALHGDFGRSYIQHQAVSQMLLDKIPVTFRLTVVAMAIAVTFGVLIGILSAVKQYSFWDTLATFFAMTGVSVPTFWLGMMLQLLFGVILHILPVSGTGGEGFHLQNYLLPGFALGYASMAMYVRLTRSSMLEVIRQDYVRTARAKGLSSRVVIFKHAMKNALIPVATQAGMDFAGLMGGAILTETIFSLPGIGSMLYMAISRRDYPVVQGVTLFLALVFVVINLLVDISYAVLDPRIRYD
ncbi:ABC transporter permease [Desulfosporosinus metallidurans]|uniref:Dipeptide transport system permease protein DppB n=1 Tax=Desulfosporosinus metallidurans TaxID=1888891 RepID=A0A1Q8R205_9FIRM|nr:ABC transporter permease [Desulfosporosinus metallidurans]OLN33703.1 Dipeptide transport system permease protein DppB [Desulfosporosinus metallidurans]